MIANKLPVHTFIIEYRYLTVDITVYKEYFTIEHYDLDNKLRNRFNIKPGKLSEAEQFLFAFFLPHIFKQNVAYDEELGFHKL